MATIVEKQWAGGATIMAASAGNNLTFVPGHECDGIATLKIREIIRLPVVRCLLRLPAHARGVALATLAA